MARKPAKPETPALNGDVVTSAPEEFQVITSAPEGHDDDAAAQAAPHPDEPHPDAPMYVEAKIEMSRPSRDLDPNIPDKIIVSAHAPRRRAGLRFGPEPMRLMTADLTQEQFIAIMDDPMLTVAIDMDA